MAPRLYRSSSLVLVSVTLIASTLGLASPASAVVCADTVAGLLARWPGDDSTAEVAHARDGTLVNGTYAPGKVANAFSFDGVGDTVTAPDNTDWALGGDFTVDTWVNFTSVPVAGHIAFVAHDEGNGYHPKWIFWWKDTGQLSFHFNTGSATVDPVSYSWTPTTGTWYHVAVTRAGSTFTLYLNGTSVATGSETTAIPDAAGPLTLGSAENNYFLDGLLDEPEIYQRALSDTEVKAINDAGANPRCAITRSTLSVTGPATAYPGDTLTLNGTLALSGGAPVDGLPIEITRSVNSGTPVALPDATAAADGSFSLQDVPGAGTVVYRASFAGSTNVSAESATATVVLAKEKSALSLSLSKSKVTYGSSVTVTAHLNGGFTNKAVTIWATPYGSSKGKLDEGKVNSSGTLSVRDTPTRNTKYSATYAGDAQWDASSATTAVKVAARWSVRSIGGYATVKGFRLYHYTPKCTVSDSTLCPKATFKLAPNHGGQRMHFQVKQCKAGKCYESSKTYRLNRKSEATIFWWFDSSKAIGWTIMYRLVFKGDADHVGSTSAWAKAKVTA